jgi:hypothetical protein
MLLKWFTKNEWRETRRSSMWEQSVGIKIFLGFLFFIIFAEILIGSIFLGMEFQKIASSDEVIAYFKTDNHIEIFNSMLLYGFALGFFVRFFLQKVPVLSIQPYLHLPIGRSKLVNYVLGKSLFAIFNFIPVLTITPFIIFQMVPEFSGFQILGYVLAILFTIVAVNFLALMFKRNLSGNTPVTIIMMIVIGALSAAEYYGLISIGKFSSMLFTGVMTNPLWLLGPLALAVFAYAYNFRDLIRHLYPEDNLHLRKSSKRNVSDFKYLKTLGQMGNLISLELKLMIRNKRPKSTVVFLPIFLLYGLIFYPNPELYGQNGWLIFVGIFMTGGVTLIYGQYLLSWESSYFDGILTHIDDFYLYFKAKYNLLVMATIACMIITLPYGYFGTKIMFINLMAGLFNMGVSSIFVIYMSTNNKKRLDLSKGAAFNYQGVSATQFLISFPVMLIPLIIYLPFWALGNIFGDHLYNIGIMSIGLMGLLALVFHRPLLKMAVNRFLERRYLIGEGFRKKY